MAIKIIPKHKKKFQEGLNLSRQRKYPEAMKIFLEILNKEPDYPPCINELGAIFFHMKDFQRSLNLFYKATQLDPKEAIYWFRFGTALYELKDYEQAIKALEKALELQPNYGEAAYNLGCSYRILKDEDKALHYLNIALGANPEREDIRILIASMKGEELKAGSDTYVKDLFNYYADNFEGHLTETLKYSIPERIRELLLEHKLLDTPEQKVLDGGCGTGLMGDEIADYVPHIIGVDLAEKMVAKAGHRKKNGKDVYEAMHCEAVDKALERYTDELDGVTAADVFVYVGDLTNTFKAARKALKAGGWFTFSVEGLPDHKDDEVKLKKSARFGHNPSHVERLCLEHGFSEIYKEERMIRTENDVPIDGYVYILKKDG